MRFCYNACADFKMVTQFSMYTGQNCSVHDQCVNSPTITSTVDCAKRTSDPRSIIFTCVVPLNKTDNMKQYAFIWNGTPLKHEVTIAIGTNVTSTPNANSAIPNVDVDENHSENCSCFQSTLTFNGTNLTALFNKTLSCGINDASTAVMISIPPRKCKFDYYSYYHNN